MAIYTRKCGRCDGTGDYPIPGGRTDVCWGCGNSEGPRGYVVVRTGADKAQHDEDMAFVRAFIPELRKRATAIAPDAATAGQYASRAKEGLWALAKREPGRLTALRASVAAGRLDDVIRALVAYE